MMNTRIIEIWCFLHSMVDGMLTISPTGTLANHKRVPVNMVNFQMEPSSARILLSIPQYLAEGLGLWAPPMHLTEKVKTGLPTRTDESKIVKESQEESRRRAIAVENEALRQSATSVAQRFSPIGEFHASVDDNGDLRLDHVKAPESKTEGGSTGIFNRLKAIRTPHDRMKEVAKQINEIPV